ncbi:hypothetical protein CRG98_017144 [Punica granatum]|uniref:Glycine-rich domain-containing protein 1-like n=1 Tax=Punica granatum TaxID=22663 RepID=A0A2I0K313_PUNGR|nr:hypothetical protein CRG98_017144 [Punica granatum]
MEDNTQELDWSKAQGVVITVDLVKAAKRQLQFLAAVDSAHCLYDGPALDHAIDRYKYCWLPLLAKHALSPITTEPLVVPLDCEWIWHCHRLNPVQYKNDCEEIYGRILDNIYVLSTTEGTCTRKTEWIWSKMYPSEPYHLERCCHSMLGAIDTDIGQEKSTKYDLVAAVKKQSSFFHKVSKSIVQDDCFLREAVTRYKAFLHLIKIKNERSIKSFVVPTYDIDLMWHSHQLNPVSYCWILDHDDRSSDSSKLKTGFTETSKLWEDTFGRRCFMAKSTFEGDGRSTKCFDNKVEITGCGTTCIEGAPHPPPCGTTCLAGDPQPPPCGTTCLAGDSI